MRRRASSVIKSGRRLATLLRDRREALIREWSRRVAEDPAIPSTEPAGEPALGDHIPALFDALVGALATPGSAVQRPVQRRLTPGYGVVEELRALSHLRAAILDRLAAERMVLRIDAAARLSAALDESMITGARALARAATEVSTRRAALVDEYHDAILLWRLGGTITAWNRGAERLYGFPASEAIGREPHGLLRTEHPRGMDEIEARLVREGRWEGELRHEARDGRTVIVDSRLVLVHDDAGRPIVLESNRDITERVLAEEARLESESRLRAVVETAVDAIITIGESGLIESFNLAAERLFGYRSDEVVGRNVKVLMPEPYRGEHDEYLARYRRTGERRIIGIGREVVGRRKDGSVFPMDLAVGEAKVGTRRIFTGIIRDVTDRKRVEEEREHLLASERAARMEAERAAHQRDEFVATVSHELRTPLNAIIGWAAMLRSGKVDAATTTRALEVIERNAEAQAQLVEDLLDMARIGSGKLRLEVREVDLEGVVENVVATHVPAAKRRRVTLGKKLDAYPCVVRGDPGRLEQIVSNLLSNAIKFTPAGGRVDVRLRRAGARAELVVRDTGEGIRPDFLPHVFDRFRQADASTTRRHRGLGLGLALVRHLVEQHGGSVRAESAGEGRGSTFTVSLPIAATRRADGEPVAPIDACGSLHGIKVLVVDDEEDARALVQRILESCDVEVVSVDCAAAALEQLPRIRPDVLISDIGMPELDGYQLIRAVRALAPEQGGATPAVALTAFARPEDRQRAMAAGYQVHLAKPIEASELLVGLASAAGRLAA